MVWALAVWARQRVSRRMEAVLFIRDFSCRSRSGVREIVGER